MPYETKRQLRKEIEDLQKSLGWIEDCKIVAESKLRALGFEHIERSLPYGETCFVWAKSPEAVTDELDAQFAHNSEIKKQAREEALTLVLEALEIKGYAQGGYTGVRGKVDYDTERFEKDLRTAVEVRAKRKAQEEAEATEKRVAGMTKETPLAEQINEPAGPNARLDIGLAPRDAQRITDLADKLEKAYEKIGGEK